MLMLRNNAIFQTKWTAQGSVNCPNKAGLTQRGQNRLIGETDFSQGLAGPTDVAGATAVLGKGVLRTGVNAEEETFRAKPVFGHRSNRAVIFRNTLDPFTVPRVRISVLLAPTPLLMWRKL